MKLKFMFVLQEQEKEKNNIRKLKKIISVNRKKCWGKREKLGFLLVGPYV